MIIIIATGTSDSCKRFATLTAAADVLFRFCGESDEMSLASDEFKVGGWCVQPGVFHSHKIHQKYHYRWDELPTSICRVASGR